MADSIVGKLIYKITGDLSDIKASLSNAEKSVNKFTKFVKSAGGLFGAAAAFKLLTGVVKDFLNAALESEQVETKLAAAMRISGQGAAAQTQQMLGLAKALSLVTTYTDEETVGAMTTLTEVGRVSAKGMRELIPLVQDLAAGMGVDLGTSASAVAKYMAGSNAALVKMGIKVPETTNATERFNAVVKALSGNFGGMAEAMAKASSGGLKQITMQFDELKEAVGTGLLQTFKGTISALASEMKANVVMNIDVKDVGSKEQAIAFIKTLRTELQRVREENSRHGGLFTMDRDIAHAAELQNKIEALDRFVRNFRDTEAGLPPVLGPATDAIIAQEDATSLLAKRYVALGKAAQKAAADAEAAADAHLVQEREAAAETQKIWDHASEVEAENAAAANEKRVADERAAAEKIKSIRQDVSDFAIQALWALEGLNNASAQRQLSELTAKQNEELANFQGTEEEKAALIKQFEKEKAKIEYEAALRSWQLQLAAAIVGGARAVISGFETQPFIPAGLLAGALATALAGLQIAAIMESKPIPAFAEGGDFNVPPGYPNDSYLMAAQTGEHVSITPAGGGGSRSRAKEVVFNLNGREFARFIQSELDDGRVLVSRGRLKR